MLEMQPDTSKKQSVFLQKVLEENSEEDNDSLVD